MYRLTERNNYGVAVMRLDIPAGAGSSLVARLADYEDTSLTPKEIIALKAERDAAVADLEKLMLYGERFRCEFCDNDKDWCAEREVCAPKWHGLNEVLA